MTAGKGDIAPSRGYRQWSLELLSGTNSSGYRNPSLFIMPASSSTIQIIEIPALG